MDYDQRNEAAKLHERISSADLVVPKGCERADVEQREIEYALAAAYTSGAVDELEGLNHRFRVRSIELRHQGDDDTLWEDTRMLLYARAEEAFRCASVCLALAQGKSTEV